MARLLLGTPRSSYVPARATRAWLPFWRAVVPRWRRRAGRLTQSAANGRAAPVPYPPGDTAAMRRAGARGPTEAWVKGSKRTLGGAGGRRTRFVGVAPWRQSIAILQGANREEALRAEVECPSEEGENDYLWPSLRPTEPLSLRSTGSTLATLALPTSRWRCSRNALI